MKRIYADFNDAAEDGSLPLTCRGSVESIASLPHELQEAEEVWLTDGDLWARAVVFRAQNGTWYAGNGWSLETSPDQTGPPTSTKS